MASRDTDFSHKALLYRSRAGLVAGVLPFIRQGVEDGDEVVVISSRGNLGALRASLTPREARTVAFEDSAGRYRLAAHALDSFQRMLAGYATAGRRVRVLSEQPLGSLPPDQVDELCRSDAAFNAVSGARGAAVICAYDERVVPRHAADMVRRSHPKFMEDGRCRANPAYTDPRTLLASHYRGPPLPPPPDGAAMLHCPRDAADAREFVASVAGRHGLTDPALDRLVTAVNEVVTNAIVHAVLDTVLVWTTEGRVVCEVRDYGFGLTDPLVGYRRPGPSSLSGRGIWLARQLVDLVEVRSGLGGSTFRLHVSPSPSGGEAPAPDDLLLGLDHASGGTPGRS